jgi:hypothetical protein
LRNVTSWSLRWNWWKGLMEKGRDAQFSGVICAVGRRAYWESGENLMLLLLLLWSGVESGFEDSLQWKVLRVVSLVEEVRI